MSWSSEELNAMSSAIFDKVRSYREYMHQHPELSYQEHQTMGYIAEQLTKIGIPHETGVAGTGVVGIIRGDHHAMDMPCVGLRADIDALPIQEDNDVPYKSTVDGVMHACGHDVHSSILLGAAEILWEKRNELPQPVKLIFQPGEEKNPGGASLMIAAGCLENPKVERMYALHVFPDLEVGKVGFKEGLYMASCDEIYITIHGKGGHGATPHQAIDTILIGSEIVTSLQTIVSRQCDPKIPCVLSFGHFEALGATNIIPAKAHLKGTFRTMDEDWRADALQRIKRQAEHIAEAHGGKAEVEISKGYPFLENDPKLTQELRTKAIELLGAENVVELPIRLTAEDFSFYAQEIPTCFFRIGVRNEEKGIVYGVHHPKFDIDVNALKVGVEMMVRAVV
jgi:amidohydrolase